jgi:hypothetical protein
MSFLYVRRKIGRNRVQIRELNRNTGCLRKVLTVPPLSQESMDFVIYPMATIRNTLITHSESDSHKIIDFGSLLFFRWEITADTPLDKFF